MSQERERQERGTLVAQECSATHVLENVDFTLTAKADRIDREEDGTLTIYDYKSGSPPSKKQVELFDKQLPLEAALAEKGAFSKIDANKVNRLEYIGLGEQSTARGQGKIQDVEVNSELTEKVWLELEALILSYQSADQPYTARQKMEKVSDVSDYDHLSRFAEWSELGEEG